MPESNPLKTAAESELIQPRGLIALTDPEAALLKRAALPIDVSASEKGPAETIRGELIRWLCSSAEARKHVDPGGLFVANFIVQGTAHHARTYPGGVLDLCSLTIPFPLIFRDCTLPPWLLLLGTQIPFLDLDGCQCGAILADVMNVRGDLYMRNGFSSNGSIRLSGATIGGDLDMSGAKVTYANRDGERDRRHERGFALNAEGIHVAGDVLLTSSSTAVDAQGNPVRFVAGHGVICFDGSRVDGDFNCVQAELQSATAADSPDHRLALSLRSANIKGHVWLRDDFKAIGGVQLPGAQIGGDLDCSGGKFTNPWKADERGTGVALDADAATISGNLRLADTFVAYGTVSLVGTTVSGTLNRKQGTFSQSPDSVSNLPRHRRRPALDLRNAHVAYVSFPKSSSRDPNAGGGQDSPQGAPPHNEDRLLDGFVYGRIVKGPGGSDWKQYLEWLANSPSGYQPQPYLQLARALRDDGDRRGAREVLVEMEKRRPRTADWEKAWGVIQEWTIGYGYKPWMVLPYWLLVVVLGAGILFYGASQIPSRTLPVNMQAYNTCPECYPTFHPIIFSIENSLPLVKFTEWESWRPIGWISVAMFFQMLLGWFFATMGVTGLTNLVRKEQ